MNVSIIGAYNTKFGAHVHRDPDTGEVVDDESIYELMREAGAGAIADAGVDPAEIDAVWVGSCSPSLFTNQEHLAPLAMEVDPEALRFKPMVRTEAACASSSVALYDAAYAIAGGRYEAALVIGVEKMNLLDTDGVTHALACSSYWPEEGARGTTFPGLFAELAKSYGARHRIDDELMRRMFAHVAAANYRNGVRNPLAHFGPGSVPEKRGLLSAEAILALPETGKGANPMIADPLRLHDCSLISDGAAALVVTSSARAKAHSGPAVEIAGVGHATERMMLSERAAPFELTGAKVAAERAFAEAGIGIGDVDFAEVHDCFTNNQLLCAEALGLSEDGRAGHDYLAGRFGPNDECPINLSGGLKSKGHPVGATGASMHTYCYKQLIGDAIGVPCRGNPEWGVVVNVGGSGVTNCVSVLRRHN